MKKCGIGRPHGGGAQEEEEEKIKNKAERCKSKERRFYKEEEYRKGQESRT